MSSQVKVLLWINFRIAKTCPVIANNQEISAMRRSFLALVLLSRLAVNWLVFVIVGSILVGGYN